MTNRAAKKFPASATGREWKLFTMKDETFVSAILKATGCFRGSVYGMRLQNDFIDGEEVEVIIRRVERSK